MSDGSSCYDVNLMDVCEGRVFSQLHFSAVTEKDAFTLAEKMKQLITEHTVDATSEITCNY